MWQPIHTQQLNAIYTPSDLVNNESALSSCLESETSSLIIYHVCLPLEPTDPQRDPLPSAWSDFSYVLSTVSSIKLVGKLDILGLSTTAVLQSCFYHRIAAVSKDERRENSATMWNSCSPTSGCITVQPRSNSIPLLL